MRVGGQRNASAALPPEKTRFPFYRRLGGPQGRFGWVRKTLPPPGLDTRTVQQVAIRYTDWAIRVHRIMSICVELSRVCTGDSEENLWTLRTTFLRNNWWQHIACSGVWSVPSQSACVNDMSSCVSLENSAYIALYAILLSSTRFKSCIVEWFFEPLCRLPCGVLTVWRHANSTDGVSTFRWAGVSGEEQSIGKFTVSCLFNDSLSYTIQHQIT